MNPLFSPLSPSHLFAMPSFGLFLFFSLLQNDTGLIRVGPNADLAYVMRDKREEKKINKIILKRIKRQLTKRKKWSILGWTQLVFGDVGDIFKAFAAKTAYHLFCFAQYAHILCDSLLLLRCASVYVWANLVHFMQVIQIDPEKQKKRIKCVKEA